MHTYKNGKKIHFSVFGVASGSGRGWNQNKNVTQCLLNGMSFATVVFRALLWRDIFGVAAVRTKMEKRKTQNIKL